MGGESEADKVGVGVRGELRASGMWEVRAGLACHLSELLESRVYLVTGK